MGLATRMVSTPAWKLFAKYDYQRFRIQTPAGWAPEHDPSLPWPVQGGVPAVLTRASAA